VSAHSRPTRRRTRAASREGERRGWCGCSRVDRGCMLGCTWERLGGGVPGCTGVTIIGARCGNLSRKGVRLYDGMMCSEHLRGVLEYCHPSPPLTKFSRTRAQTNLPLLLLHARNPHPSYSPPTHVSPTSPSTSFPAPSPSLSAPSSLTTTGWFSPASQASSAMCGAAGRASGSPRAPLR
jgi:hypothetical protein